MSFIERSDRRAPPAETKSAASPSKALSSVKSVEDALSFLRASLRQPPAQSGGKGGSAQASQRRLAIPQTLTELSEAAVALIDDPKQVTRLLERSREHPGEVAGLLQEGASLQEVGQLSDPQFAVLRAVDPGVRRALVRADVSLAQVAAVAPLVRAADFSNPQFVPRLKSELAAGRSAADAVVFAVYRDVVADRQLADPAFRAELSAAHAQGQPAGEAIRQARALGLTVRLGGALSAAQALALKPSVLSALEAEDPKRVRAFVALGLTVQQYIDTPAQTRQALLAANPVAVKALLDAGMGLEDAAAGADTISIAEATDPAFVAQLRKRLAAGLPAPDAIIAARYTKVASEAELSDPQFIDDIAHAATEGYGSKTQALHYARANALVRHTGGSIDLNSALSRSDDFIARLMAIDAGQIAALRARGVTIELIVETDKAERSALLAGDAQTMGQLVRGLLSDAKMNVHDVAKYAGLIRADEATPEFVEKIRVRLAGGASAAAAIAMARYGDALSSQELGRPDFVDSLLRTPLSDNERQADVALTVMNGLGCLRGNVPIFEAAEKVASPGSCPDNNWFAIVGVLQVARMEVDSPEWEQLNGVLRENSDRPPPTLEQRKALIEAARGLVNNWDYLCENAGALNLHLRPDGFNIDFRSDNLDDINFTPLIEALGNVPTGVNAGAGLNVISALQYARSNVRLFEAAEKVRSDASTFDNGWFAGNGVNQLADIQPDDGAWGQIERLYGRPLTQQEREFASRAARGLRDNYDVLLKRAGAIGLHVESGYIRFQAEDMDHLNFGVLTDQMGPPHTRGALDALDSARRHQLATDLPGANAISALNSGQLARLMAMNPAGVKLLVNNGCTLAQCSELDPAQVDFVGRADPVLRPLLVDLDPDTTRLVHSLQDAGMQAKDIAAHALATVAPDEAVGPFLQSLKQRLAAGAGAAQAIAGARFGDRVSDQELTDPVFVEHLLHPDAREVTSTRGSEARSMINGLGYAREHTDVFEAAEKVADSSSTFGNGWFASNGVDQLAGMNVYAAAWQGIENTLGHSLTLAERQTAIKAGKDLKNNRSYMVANAASLGLQLHPDNASDLIFKAKHLADVNMTPLIALLDSAPASVESTEMDAISALQYAGAQADVFLAVQQWVAPEADTTRKVFDQQAVNQIAAMGATDPNWTEIEQIVGRPLSLRDHQRLIGAAQGLQGNWSRLCANAAPLGLTLQAGRTDNIEFTPEPLRTLDVVKALGALGSQFTPLDSQATNVISALDFVRHNIDLFDAAESLADPGGTVMGNHFFAKLGVFKVASLEVDDSGWKRIEGLNGRVFSIEERQAAIGAARGLKNNWALLCERAGRIGLTLREGTTGIIDFKDDNLAHLNFGALTDQLTTPVTNDRVEVLSYARAKTLEEKFDATGSHTPGTEAAALLKLAPEQIDRLKGMDPAAVKALMGVGRNIFQIADLAAGEVAALAAQAPLVQWVLSLGPYSLADIAKLSKQELQVMADAKNEKATLAPADYGNTPPGTNSIRRPVGLPGGFLVYQYGPTLGGEQGMPGTFFVTGASNFDLYAGTREQQKQDASQQINATRAEFGLPKLADFDVSMLSSSELRDPAKPDDGFFTINELASKNLIQKFQKMLTDKEIAGDDPRAKLLRALEARTAASEGMETLPYFDDVHLKDIHRKYRGGEGDAQTEHLSGLDMRELIDVSQVDKQISGMFADPGISADYEAILAQALKTVPDTEITRVRTDLKARIESPTYLACIEKLKDQGKSDLAEEMIRSDTAALALVDPDAATEASQNLAIYSLQSDLESAIDRPADMDDASLEQATRDSVAIAIQSLRSGSGLARHGSQIALDTAAQLEKTFNSDAAVNNLSKVIKELMVEARRDGVPVTDISEQRIAAAMDRAHIPATEQAAMKPTFLKLQVTGLWGSIGGAAAIASFGYKLSKGAWSKDSTATQRFGAARDLISAMSVMTHGAKLGATVIDRLWTYVGNNPDGDRAWNAMHFDRDVIEILNGKDAKKIPNWAQVPTAAQVTAAADAGDLGFVFDAGQRADGGYFGQPDQRIPSSVTNPLAAAGDPAAAASAAPNARLPAPATPSAPAGAGPLNARVQEAMEKRFKHMFEVANPAASKPVAGLIRRWSLVTLRTLGTASDLAGIADIVLGGIGVKQAAGEGNVKGIVSNSFGIGGGVALTWSGSIGMLALFGRSTPGLTRTIAPLFLIGTAASLTKVVIDNWDGIKNFFTLSKKPSKAKQLHDRSEQENNWFAALRADHLLQADSGDKLEYMRNAFAVYGNDNVLKGSRSYLDSQPAEWAHFQNTQQDPTGSDFRRMSWEDHVKSTLTSIADRLPKGFVPDGYVNGST